MLKVENLTKKFGGLTAVNDVSFFLNKGEILGLIGPNGSGKTTIFNLITSFLKPTSGKVKFNDEDISYISAHEVSNKGISRTFQITSILMDLSIEENIKAGLFKTIKTNFIEDILQSKKYKKEEEKANERIKEVLKIIGLYDKKKMLARNIPPVDQRKLMIGIALAKEPQILMLDEPAAGTSKEEQKELVEIIRRINQFGITILVIEHHMDVIMNVCNRIIALNFGEKIAEGLPEEIQKNKEVIEAYLGGESDVS